MTQVYNPKEMAARGKIGGHALRSKHDPLDYTRNARRIFLAKFIPDDPSLSEQERLARAQASLKVYMLRLARLSAKARQNGGKGAQVD